MHNFTFSDSEKISKEEGELKRYCKLQQNNNTKGLSKQSIANVLAYSKAYSVRKSEQIGFLEQLLN